MVSAVDQQLDQQLDQNEVQRPSQHDSTIINDVSASASLPQTSTWKKRAYLICIRRSFWSPEAASHRQKSGASGVPVPDGPGRCARARPPESRTKPLGRAPCKGRRERAARPACAAGPLAAGGPSRAGALPRPGLARPQPAGQVAPIRAARLLAGGERRGGMDWAWGALALLPAATPWGLALLAALGGAAWLARRPLRLWRGPEAAGYLGEAGWSRAQVARRVRRGRRTGQLPPVYPNGWFCLLESARLRRGEVRGVAALGQQFAVFRDPNGKSYVVDAYCPHLGANLSVGGHVVGSCIECPFHGWQFSGKDGKCTRIPYAEKVPEFAKIKVWPSCEVGGVILVWYHCDGVNPTWQVPELEEVASGAWTFHGITDHFVSAHIEEIPENAADIAHLSFLHESCIMNGVDLRHRDSKFWKFIKHHWKAEWQPDPEPETHCSCLIVKHSVTIFGKHLSLLDLMVSARQIGPGLVFLHFKHSFLGQGVMIHSVTPVEPLLQHVIHRIYYQKSIPGFIPKFILWAESIQFERDIMIWNNKQYISKPLLVKEDAAIQRHRRWYSQFYSAHSPTFTSQNNGLDW
uniref:cholesterol 7-desaturase nvd-like n=1 Tax=Euleptes europaea TaxID=460621 RepID=UPI002541036F|nr:cholesterol 7-desaturase nvd-like [Euleptes europaea]